ncbi:unnamed protein product [Gordionus sp. m RMFG-2023]
MNTEIFEINDFTDSSEFEKFVSIINKYLKDWLENIDEIINFHLSEEPNKEWIKQDQIINYADDKFLLTLYILNKKVCKTDVETNIYLSNPNHIFASKTHHISRWFGFKKFIILKHINQSILSSSNSKNTKFLPSNPVSTQPLTPSQTLTLLSALALALQQFRHKLLDISSYHHNNNHPKSKFHDQGNQNLFDYPDPNIPLFVCINEEFRLYQGMLWEEKTTTTNNDNKKLACRLSLEMLYFTQPLGGLAYLDSLTELLPIANPSQREQTRSDKLTDISVSLCYSFVLMPIQTILHKPSLLIVERNYDLFPLDHRQLSENDLVLDGYRNFTDEYRPNHLANCALHDILWAMGSLRNPVKRIDLGLQWLDLPLSYNSEDDFRYSHMSIGLRLKETETDCNLVEYYDTLMTLFKSADRDEEKGGEIKNVDSVKIQSTAKLIFSLKGVPIDDDVLGCLLGSKFKRLTDLIDRHHHSQGTKSQEPFLHSLDYMRGDILSHEERGKESAFKTTFRENTENYQKALDKLVSSHNVKLGSLNIAMTNMRNNIATPTNSITDASTHKKHYEKNKDHNAKSHHKENRKIISDALMDAIFWTLFPDSRPSLLKIKSSKMKLYTLSPLIDPDINAVDLGTKFKLSPPHSLTDLLTHTLFMLANFDSLIKRTDSFSHDIRSDKSFFDLEYMHPSLLQPLDPPDDPIVENCEMGPNIENGKQHRIAVSKLIYDISPKGAVGEDILDSILGALKEFWKEFVLELRYRWDNCIPITLIEDAKPDYKYCLLHQKLQMLNRCIKIKKQQQQYSSLKLDQLTNEDSEGDTFFECQNDNSPSLIRKKSESENDRKSKSQNSENLSKFGDLTAREVPEGRSHTLEGNVKLFNGTDYLYVPITQEPPFMTEDHLMQHQSLLLHLTSASSDKNESKNVSERAQFQSRTLASDMRAFKAANPTCDDDIRDFLRWYSPADLIWDDKDKSKCRLSDRMNIGYDKYSKAASDLKSKDEDINEDINSEELSEYDQQLTDNIWTRLWFTETLPMPACKQARLFDHLTQGELALHHLAKLDLPAILHDSSGSVWNHMAPYAVKCVSVLANNLSNDFANINLNEHVSGDDSMNNFKSVTPNNFLDSKQLAGLLYIVRKALEKLSDPTGFENITDYDERFTAALNKFEADRARIQYYDQFVKLYFGDGDTKENQEPESENGHDKDGAPIRYHHDLKSLSRYLSSGESRVDIKLPPGASTNHIANIFPIFRALISDDPRKVSFFKGGDIELLIEPRTLDYSCFENKSYSNIDRERDQSPSSNHFFKVLSIENIGHSGGDEDHLFKCGLTGKEYSFQRKQYKDRNDDDINAEEMRRILYVSVEKKEFRIAKID